MGSASWIYNAESRSNYFFIENSDQGSSRVKRAEHHIILSDYKLTSKYTFE